MYWAVRTTNQLIFECDVAPFSFQCTPADLEKAMPAPRCEGVCASRLVAPWSMDLLHRSLEKKLTSKKDIEIVENREQQSARTAQVGLLSWLRSSLWGEPRQQQTPSTLVEVTFEQPAPSEEESRRGWILIVAGFAMILLHSASTSCWASINQIHLEQSEGDLFAIQAKLLLLGSSGRCKGGYLQNSLNLL